MERLRGFFRATVRSAIDREIVPKQAMFVVDMLRNVRALYEAADEPTREALLEDARSLSTDQHEELARTVVASLGDEVRAAQQAQARGAVERAVAVMHQVAVQAEKPGLPPTPTVTLLEASVEQALEELGEGAKPIPRPPSTLPVSEATLEITVQAAVLDRTIDVEPPDLPDGDAAAELVAALEERGYELAHLLGDGASGRVYYARHRGCAEGTATPCAVKIGRLHHQRQFEREIAALRAVEHEHLVRYHDDGTAAGHFWIAMDFAGIAVAELMQRHGRLGADVVAHILRQALEGLAALHREGLLHRDLKPRNILIDERQHVRLADFGLTKACRESTSEVSASVGLMGTPRYMSPEQIHERSLTPASDLWSLGVTAYELFTGEPLFRATNPMALGHQIAEQPISLDQAELPMPLRQFLECCLERQVEKRFADANEALQAFEPVSQALQASARLRAQLAESAGEAPAAELVEVATQLARLEAGEASQRETVAAATPGAEAEAPRYFDVVLEQPGEEHKDVLKLVRKLTEADPARASALLETTPVTLLEGWPRKEAIKAQKKLSAAGAVVNVHPRRS